MPKGREEQTTGVSTETRKKTELPPLFRVIMHNDDYTTMEFVVEVLQQVFRRSPTDANLIMLNIHYKGRGVCGTYPLEIAETKISKAHEAARDAGYPLRCSMEED